MIEENPLKDAEERDKMAPREKWSNFSINRKGEDGSQGNKKVVEIDVSEPEKETSIKGQ